MSTDVGDREKTPRLARFESCEPTNSRKVQSREFSHYATILHNDWDEEIVCIEGITKKKEERGKEKIKINRVRRDGEQRDNVL